MNVDDGRIMRSWRSCLLYLLYMLYQLITFCGTYMYMYLLYTYVYLTMYCSLPGSPYCPVMSFQNYVRRLHPSNERLWQKPLDSISENSPVWYCNSGVGEKTLSSFMSRLSKSCGLAHIYTNHSIRATGATILSKTCMEQHRLWQ